MNTDEKLLSDSVIGFDALYDSMRKCKKGVMWKASVSSFYLNGIERTLKLCYGLNDGTYKARKPMHFRVTHPKPRDIASIYFTDRVYQRSLNDNVVYPIMTKSFIYDNYACQKSKGTDRARERLKEFLLRYYRKHGYNGYVAQVDIKGYYPNMSHKVCEEIFKRKLPDDIYKMVEEILHNQYEGDKGYNPGSQLIQIAGISMLDGLDHYIKERLRIKFYIRYMDDFILIHHDSDYLEYCLCEIEKYLESLKFSVNPEKTRIYPLSDGIPFLGFTFKLSETGKAIMLIKPENVKAERKKLYRLVKKSKNGYMPKEKVDESYAAWRNHASKGNTYKCIQRMDTYYKSLWRE